MNAVDRMFRAFADPTRLRLLHLLRAGESRVGALVSVLGVPQPTVSRHLAHLRRAGLVAVRREGRSAHYRLAEPTSRFHRTLVGCLASCFAEVPELRADAERAGLARGGPEACCPPATTGAAR